MKLFLNLRNYRHRFMIASLALSSLLGIGLFLPDFNQRLRYSILLGIASLLTHGLVFWKHRRVVGVWLSSIVPSYLMAGSLLFEMLLPGYWWLRLIIWFVIMILIYASFLTSNIFLVSAQRTIKLFQAALGVSLVLVIAAVFLIIDALLAFRLMPWWNMIFSLILILPVSLYLIWSVDLSSHLKRRYLYYSFILTLLVGEGSLVISFWPTPITVKAIFIASLVYSIGGLYQAHFLEKVFTQTEREFWWLLIAVFVSVLLVTRWG